jgi:hypothetical protein
MSYQARIVADSIGPHEHRLTTIVATFPRFILAELNTHRMLSRNSASSRAIPPETLIQRVVSDPFVPETFNTRVKGMGVGDEILGDDAVQSREAWLWAVQQAVTAAERLVEIGVDKSRVNRLLEPFLWHTALISATEWSNFFALRDHPNAQPEFQIVARMMRDAMESSTPREVEYGYWHLPFVDLSTVGYVEHEGREHDFWPLVSAGRCFVVSYDRLDEIEHEDPYKSFGRADGGKDIGHWSPLEHPAVCTKPALPHDYWYGNFQGWRQLRKHYPNENDFSKVLAAA